MQTAAELATAAKIQLNWHILMSRSCGTKIIHMYSPTQYE